MKNLLPILLLLAVAGCTGPAPKPAARPIRLSWADFPWTDPTMPRLVLYTGEKPDMRACWFVQVRKGARVEFDDLVIPPAQPPTDEQIESGKYLVVYTNQSPQYQAHAKFPPIDDVVDWSAMYDPSTVPGCTTDGQVSVDSLVLVLHGLRGASVKATIENAPTVALEVVGSTGCKIELNAKNCGYARPHVSLGTVRSWKGSGGNEYDLMVLGSWGPAVRVDDTFGFESFDGVMEGVQVLEDTAVLHVGANGGLGRVKVSGVVRGAPRLTPVVALGTVGLYFDQGTNDCETTAHIENVTHGVVVLDGTGHKVFATYSNVVRQLVFLFTDPALSEYTVGTEVFDQGGPISTP